MSYNRDPKPSPANYPAELAATPRYWLDRVRAIPSRVRRYIKSTPVEFTNAVCQTFMENKGSTDGANHIITDHLANLGKIRKSLSKYQDQVLQVYGCAAEYQEGDAIGQRLVRLIDWLEEVLMLVLLDPELVQARYRARNFAFQKVSFRDHFSFEDTQSA